MTRLHHNRPELSLAALIVFIPAWMLVFGPALVAGIDWLAERTVHAL